MESNKVTSTLLYHFGLYDKIPTHDVAMSTQTTVIGECGLLCASSETNCSVFFNSGDGRCLITHQNVRYDTAYTAASGFKLYVTVINGKCML